MEVRRFGPEERADLAGLRMELFPDEAATWPLDDYLGGTGAAFGAYDGGKLIGYAAAQLRSHAEGAWDRPAYLQRIAYLEEWYVRPGHRRRGAGRMLVEAVAQWAAGIRATHLASDTEIGNDASIAAHRALGLAEIERAVHFLKPLAPAPPADPAPAEAVELRELDEETGRAVMGLRVTPLQGQFVAPNHVSLAQAFLTDDILVRGIFAGDLPVGFAMLSTRQQRYYLWRFMIDYRHQGRGYGRRAMELLIDLVRAQPGASELFLSYVPAPGGPGRFYEGLGFRDTGVVHGVEVEARLEL